MQVRDTLYIGGEWVAPAGAATIDVVDPATEQVIATIPEGSPADVDRAVSSARGAFDTWAATPVEQRAKHLTQLADGLSARAEEIARTITSEMGAPARFAQAVQAALPISVMSSYATIVAEYAFEERVGNSLVVREPVGVVGAITPWNYPLHQIVAKVAPALGAGCTVVLKPSEVAPLTAFLLAEVVHDVGLPPGVFNLVTGTGPVVGEAIASHPDVDMVSFTGSTRAGRRVSELAAGTIKRVALELGGKSANVLLDDADLATAAKVGVADAFQNAGQKCTALTRMLVPRSRQDEVVEIVRGLAEKYLPDDPTQESTRLGPLVSDAQRERVRDYIRTGVAEGARLVVGGAEPPEGRERGYYVRPTVFADVRADMTIAQEEIFGPVLAVMPYDDEDDAVRIANSTVYGLAGSVWSGDLQRAEAFARRMRTGQVDVNGGRFNPLAPFGGYKQSGNGRELGTFGLEEFLEVKALQLPT
ncbi:MAG TPA: aldehyde dehydrogenase family protein [Mycobacteriales bacterium]|nr:aldehyde dehydrogenase family protein [Mycobacteriales bacterium]